MKFTPDHSTYSMIWHLFYTINAERKDFYCITNSKYNVGKIFKIQFMHRHKQNNSMVCFPCNNNSIFQLKFTIQSRGIIHMY